MVVKNLLSIICVSKAPICCKNQLKIDFGHDKLSTINKIDGDIIC